ncbi:hypothetical protein EV421DRAFT_1710192 [Armillaria borealis]|uniref:Short-chain dehydrogenase n=1 Tax=Armillaria borealis TaxID=47425 RepID=A0AA39MRE1_9AGAR|nr:hypothetical protein EV421DRAFT_1710192 [Armillaria borealis]
MARKTHEQFVADQHRVNPPVVTVDLTGKTVVVIGANIGLGFEASKHFARMNPERLILACRNEEKGKDALLRLQEDTDYSKAELWIIDLANFGSVTAFADKCARELDRLDILVENAGMAPFGRYDVVEGWETCLYTNNLGPGLLAIRLVPKMIGTARRFGVYPRIVVVASDVHYWTTFEKELVESPNILAKLSSKEYSTPEIMKRRYFDSKLLNVLFARAFQQRLPPSTITVNSVNPGLCISNLRSKLPEEYQEANAKQEAELAFTTEEGSRQLVFSAVGGANDEDKLRGAYISLSEVVEESDFVISEDGKVVQDKIWDEMLAILEGVDPKVADVAREYLKN